MPDNESTIDSEPMIAIAWTESIRYQTRITLTEAHELLINEYRDDLRLTRTPTEIADLLAELDLDEHLRTHREETWHDYLDHDIHWIKPT